MTKFPEHRLSQVPVDDTVWDARISWKGCPLIEFMAILIRQRTNPTCKATLYPFFRRIPKRNDKTWKHNVRWGIFKQNRWEFLTTIHVEDVFVQLRRKKVSHDGTLLVKPTYGGFSVMPLFPNKPRIANRWRFLTGEVTIRNTANPRRGHPHPNGRVLLKKISC